MSAASRILRAAAVDQRQIDYGNQHFSANLNFTIKVANAGDGMLRFSDQQYIEVLDGC